MSAEVVVVGAGSWGTTVAALLGSMRSTTLWARSPELADELGAQRRNRRYLPDLELPAMVTVTSTLAQAVRRASVVLVAVPSHGFRPVLAQMAAALAPGAAVVSLAKGIEEGTNLRMSQVIAEELPGHPAGVLSGPTLAHEMAAGQPAAALVALPTAELAEYVQSLLHCGTFRVYRGTDVVGCEIAGATKNVMAIAAGACDGSGLGENTRALVVTRGLAEQRRLGMALGGHPYTFDGLAGVGDLVATCTSPRSRNRTVGFELGRGRDLGEVLSGMHMVAEGVKSARPLVELAASYGVEMPIAAQVADLVEGRTTPAEALIALMERPAKPEWEETPIRPAGPSVSRRLD